jgi:dihydroxyacetone kinase-like protein
MFHVAKAIDGGAGVLFLYGHYFGDKMNFDLAAEMLSDEGIRVETVRGSDDVASAPKQNWQQRRGVAGIFFAYKIAGACAEAMHSLDEVKRVTEKAISQIATMGVALSSCIIPASGKVTFRIGEDEMEVGMGIHGEPGIRRTKLASAKEIASEIVPYLTKDLQLKAGDEVAVLINGSGATPLEELYIMNKETHIILKSQGIHVYKTYVGEYATSMDMVGCSISLFKLDQELRTYLDAPADSPFFTQMGKG